MFDNTKEKALEYFHGDYNCAQSVFHSVIEEEGLFFDEAPIVASAFGGGLIGRGEVCGAVSGALMALGILSTKLAKDFVEQKKLAGEMANNFYNLFESHFDGHSTCFGLTGVDPNDPNSKQKQIDAGVFKENCPKFVAKAVQYCLEVFTEKKEK